MANSWRLKRKKLLGKTGAWVFLRLKGRLERADALEAERIGARLGRLLMRLSKKHRTRCVANLSMAYPDLGATEVEAMAQRVFEHFGIVGADFLRTEQRTDAEVVASFEPYDLDPLRRIQEAGKGAILITPHFGNWERLAQLLKSEGLALHAVARNADDQSLDEQVRRIRESAGMVMLSRGNAARAILGALRQNLFVAILPDQNCAESFVPFFGKPAGTVLGPAVLSGRTGSPVIPVGAVRVAPGRYRVLIGQPIQPANGYEDPQVAFAAAMNEALEAMIRQYPEQWLWFHDRWKSARQRGLL